MTNKILVTAAAGNVGSHVLRLLKDRDANIVAGVHRGGVEGVEFVPIDYADIASLEKAMQGISTVFMVIPTHPAMVQWGKNFIGAAKTSGVKNIVRFSASLATVASPLKVIELLNATDHDVKSCGIDYTIIAPQFLCKILFIFMRMIIKMEQSIFLLEWKDWLGRCRRCGCC